MKSIGQFSKNIVYILLMIAIAGSYSLIGYVVGVYHDAPVRCNRVCSWASKVGGTSPESAFRIYINCYPVCMDTEE